MSWRMSYEWEGVFLVTCCRRSSSLVPSPSPSSSSPSSSVLGRDVVHAREGVPRLHDSLLLSDHGVHQPLPQLEVEGVREVAKWCVRGHVIRGSVIIECDRGISTAHVIAIVIVVIVIITIIVIVFVTWKSSTLRSSYTYANRMKSDPPLAPLGRSSTCF